MQSIQDYGNAQKSAGSKVGEVVIFPFIKTYQNPPKNRTKKCPYGTHAPSALSMSQHLATFGKRYTKVGPRTFNLGPITSREGQKKHNIRLAHLGPEFVFAYIISARMEGATGGSDPFQAYFGPNMAKNKSPTQRQCRPHGFKNGPTRFKETQYLRLTPPPYPATTLKGI